MTTEAGKSSKHSFSLFFRPHSFLFVHFWHLWMECFWWVGGGVRCALVATDAHFLVETTGCWFTPAPQCEQESGARTGFRLPENSLDSAGGLSWGPARCSFRHATKRRQVGGPPIWPSCMVRSGLWGHGYISEVNVNKAELWGQEVGEVDFEMFCIKLYVWGGGGGVLLKLICMDVVNKEEMSPPLTFW